MDLEIDTWEKGSSNINWKFKPKVSVHFPRVPPLSSLHHIKVIFGAQTRLIFFVLRTRKQENPIKSRTKPIEVQLMAPQNSKFSEGWTLTSAIVFSHYTSPTPNFLIFISTFPSSPFTFSYLHFNGIRMFS